MNMKKRNIIIASVLTLCIATVAFAQLGNDDKGPQGQDKHQGPPPKAKQVMDSGVTGVYILDGPNFTKFDSATLVQSGQLELGITADKPVDTTDTDKSMLPPPMPIPGDFKIYNPSDSASEYLLVVVGDTFYKIDGSSFTVAVKTLLPEIQKPKIKDVENKGDEMQPDGPGPGIPQDGGPDMGGPGMGRPGPGGPGMPRPAPPKLDLNGDVLYILRGHNLTAINVTDGSITASVETVNKNDVSTVKKEKKQKKTNLK